VEIEKVIADLHPITKVTFSLIVGLVYENGVSLTTFPRSKVHKEIEALIAYVKSKLPGVKISKFDMKHARLILTASIPGTYNDAVNIIKAEFNIHRPYEINDNTLMFTNLGSLVYAFLFFSEEYPEIRKDPMYTKKD
jgi:hypothetical protein